MSRLAALLAAVLLVLVACAPAPPASPTPPASPLPTATPAASPSPSPSPTRAPAGDLAALYREIQDQVVAERGLAAKERLEPTILSADEVRVRIREQFEKDNPADEIAVAEETLKALGLLPADASLADLYVDLLGSQVAGFYDPETGEIVVVSKAGAIGPTEKVTYAHEFLHALQDQHFGLDGIDLDAPGQGDRSLARLALVEGDATLLMTRWLVDHLTPDEIGELLVVDPEAQALLDAMPAILRETLLFPYQQGFVFVTGIWTTGGWEAVDRAFGRLPDSTEQILHPAKYEARERPVEVALDADALAKAMGAGWVGTPEDTLGEFQLSVWLREHGVLALPAQAAAAGWGGDRLAYLRGPNGAYALALLTVWDTAADADEFRAAARTAIGSLPGAAMISAGGDARSVRIFVASDAATLERFGEVATAAGL
ncbi:MAG TPA: hypothetical protein VLM76_02470 [Patescibacteria group bacterium]|nr:hypothetical protein [Patescibacteria group bacterium]